MQSYSRARSGCAAYLALKSHYLGDAYQTRLCAKADQTLETSYYDGTRRNFTYERYTEQLQRAFTDLESTGELVSTERKIRVLLTGIHDPRLESAKNQILATPNLRTSFELASSYMAEVLDNKVSYSATTRKARISAVHVNNKGNKNNGNGNGKNGNKSFNPNRYFPYKEWIKLSKEQQQLVRETRDAKNSSTKKRTASAVSSGSKKKKNNDGSSTSTTDESHSSSEDDQNEARDAGIGAIMSQRKNRGKERI